MEFKGVIRYIAVMCLCLASFNACLKEGDRVYRFSANSYIYEYITYDAIKVSTDNRHIHVEAKPPTSSYGANSTDETAKKLYEDKRAMYGDIGYDLTFSTLHPLDSYNHAVQDRNFVSIKVFSDVDFNENLPAGSDLSGVFWFASRSPYLFIKSGYQDLFRKESDFPDYYMTYLRGSVWMLYLDFYDGIWPVYGLLSELSAEDFILLGFARAFPGHNTVDIFTLFPAALPDELTMHELTVELTDTDNNVLQGKVLFDFAKAELFQ